MASAVPRPGPLWGHNLGVHRPHLVLAQAPKSFSRMSKACHGSVAPLMVPAEPMPRLKLCPASPCPPVFDGARGAHAASPPRGCFPPLRRRGGPTWLLMGLNWPLCRPRGAHAECEPHHSNSNPNPSPQQSKLVFIVANCSLLASCAARASVPRVDSAPPWCVRTIPP